MASLLLALKALRELGSRQGGLYGLYKIGLLTGHYRRLTPDDKHWTGFSAASFEFHPVISMPGRDNLASSLDSRGRDQLVAEADEIVSGAVRLFGGPPVSLELVPPGPLLHWTEYEHGRRETDGRDVKFIWEPARFGWAFTLGRAYTLAGDERYASAFWAYTEAFLEANPPYMGPNWTSAQEVALRLIALTFALQVMAGSPGCTLERKDRLSKAIAAHAGRIPPTLVYARAQNNNHLLSEAAGLFTAGLALPAHPSAQRWTSLGWRWFHQGLQSQIALDGTYMQHSTNYHRLMLQLALWMVTISRDSFPLASQERLAAATRWLLALLDPESGRAPNLGPNDGAYILPLSACPFYDYRPVLQAAATAFLDERPFAGNACDEMSLWLRRNGKLVKGMKGSTPLPPPSKHPLQNAPHILRLAGHDSWAYLRAARFTGRPGHADQLHLDLWWRGMNVAQDAGTYLYNAQPPWDNPLVGAAVHNTLTVNERDQMTRAGSFLYLDWAQARVLSHEHATDGTSERLVAQHDGYKRLGAFHRRAVTIQAGGSWLVEDVLQPAGPWHALSNKHFTVCLHWLSPDWPWEIENAPVELSSTKGGWHAVIRLQSPQGWVRLKLTVPGQDTSLPAKGFPRLQIARAGELVYGDGTVPPSLGWSSPTYGDKIPALSMRLSASGSLPLSLESEWSFF